MFFDGHQNVHRNGVGSEVVGRVVMRAGVIFAEAMGEPVNGHDGFVSKFAAVRAVQAVVEQKEMVTA